MAEAVHEDLVEQILIRSDVRDLIRYKSVCKSWRSLITSSRFFIRHKDRHKDRRIILHNYDIKAGYRLAGSSNGLVCVSNIRRYKVFVGNPITGEVRDLEPPPGWTIEWKSCWGFGYDSSRDDYKVFSATLKGDNQTRVQVFSLKSNTWREIAIVKYKFANGSAGMLCNGALHWIVRSDDKNYNFIVSYDLSNDGFKEIPLPVDARFKLSWINSHLGNHKGCLSHSVGSESCDIWVMNKYDVKESWELIRQGSVRTNDTLCYLRTTPPEHRLSICYQSSRIYLPIFVQSPVSPHLNVNR